MGHKTKGLSYRKQDASISNQPQFTMTTNGLWSDGRP